VRVPAKGRASSGKPDPLAIWGQVLDQRPILVALAGPDGAGKTTFYHVHLRAAGLRFVNADEVARELDIDAYEAARIITELRQELVRQRESFVFETVFSDPVGDKLGFLKTAAQSGYTVVLCFVGISGPDTCEQRVAMRASQGGHDVPHEKLVARSPRTTTTIWPPPFGQLHSSRMVERFGWPTRYQCGYPACCGQLMRVNFRYGRTQ
jgi:predicted ABC-type ATPase